MVVAGGRLEKSRASNGILVPLTQYAEVEEYRVELSDVRVLELVIVADISRGSARASLKSLRLS